MEKFLEGHGWLVAIVTIFLIIFVGYFINKNIDRDDE